MKSLKGFYKKWAEKQDGAVAVIVALALTVILGSVALVADLGIAYLEASRLQNALDSAALAAVQELPAANVSSAEWTSAAAIANEYAQANGLDSVTLTPITKNGKIMGVKASGDTEVEYTFARILGNESGAVCRLASAEMKPVSGVKGLVPLAALDSMMTTIQPGNTITLKVGKDQNKEYPDNGWFGALSLGGSGAEVYGNNIVDGYSGYVTTGSIFYTENGNMAGPTISSVTDRIYKPGEYDHRSCTYDSHEEDCPRLIIAPVVKIIDESGHTKVEVTGFASFFLVSVSGDAGKASIEAKYISTTIPGASTEGSPKDYGVYSIKLTQ
ncbi:pilus assembly protein TadG-related protein [Sinanaerobacter chloroacetimidivorans]|uniref:Pilus assembly protein n=1 Tax=Sinanaerobacter chloroacetimidivorans TaxID=2818044 RepID=A0A8J8B353_9FIRM|nr:TadE/TadG family type IV pilus assembly protein [Sinanaerobacter chloroacetimidivorans]MBR0600009.1 pilus assembly protein [Sinanaerobacter chloroacetimidivorans]